MKAQYEVEMKDGSVIIVISEVYGICSACTALLREYPDSVSVGWLKNIN